MLIHDFFADGQSQPSSGLARLQPVAAAEEPLEQVGQIFLRNDHPLIVYLNQYARNTVQQRTGCQDAHAAAWRGVGHRVANQVGEYLQNLGPIQVY